MINVESEKSKTANESYLMAALSYFPPVSVIMLLLKKNDSFVIFHAKQGVIVMIGMVAYVVPFFGWFVGFVVFLAGVAGFIKALQGERYKLPVIYQLSEKLPI